MNPLSRTHHVLLVLLVLAALAVVPAVHAQTATPTPATSSPLAPSPEPTAAGDDTAEDPLAAQIESLLARMSVADKVGQLFLIGFPGNTVDFDSDIAELIYGYRIGGVVLSPRNGNFSNEKGVDTPVQVASLVNQLQALAFGALLSPAQALPSTAIETWPPDGAIAMEQATAVAPVNLPLFIAVEQAGDGLPGTALRRGFTPLPSELALGATWNPELANLVGQIVGRELSAVGVNLVLGPNLDVLEQPRPDIVGSLGIHSFGGDPFWTSRMGRAYIAGVHIGSSGEVATVARHFPGAGDADRLPDQEVAIVQRSAADLARVALPPFLAVTRGVPSVLDDEGDPGSTDAMMSGHIRYSGYQGSSLGRNTPLSLAPELDMVLNDQGLADWRTRGGVLVSNVLGAPAIRRYYDPDLTEFPYRRVALDAFTAGHDVLYLARFSLDDQWESEKQNIKETIGFFQDRYILDADFAAQVDAAVRRILRLKLRLYQDAGPDVNDPTVAPPVLPAQVLVRGEELAVLEETRAEALVTVGQVAREGFTLLYPEPAGVDVPSAVPQAGDQILIFTDSRLVRECDSCIAEATVGPDELANIILRLYGPEGTGQIQAEQITSLTFADLAELMQEEQAADASQETVRFPTPTPTGGAAGAPLIVADPDQTDGADPLVPVLSKNDKINQRIDQADWILFAMLDVDSARYPNSNVLKEFLRRRGNQLATKHLVVLGLHAPYFLDATEISKLNGYYGVYSKIQPFLESAVRGLFRAFTPTGAPPVSVPGTRFGSLAERLQPDPAQPIALQVMAPDGTLLVGSSAADGSPQPIVNAGQAVRVQAGPILDHNGEPVRDGTIVDVIVTYADDPADSEVEPTPTQRGIAVRDVVMNRAGMVQVTARAGEAVSAEEVSLSVQGAPAAEASLPVTVVAPTTTSTATEPLTVATEVESAVPGDPVPGQRINLVSLAVALLTIVATSSLLLIVQVRVLPRQTLVHSMLWAVNFGLLAYILYGLGLVPGGDWLQTSLRVWGAGLVVFIAMILPLVWLQLRME